MFYLPKDIVRQLHYSFYPEGLHWSKAGNCPILGHMAKIVPRKSVEKTGKMGYDRDNKGVVGTSGAAMPTTWRNPGIA